VTSSKSQFKKDFGGNVLDFLRWMDQREGTSAGGGGSASGGSSAGGSSSSGRLSDVQSDVQSDVPIIEALASLLGCNIDVRVRYSYA
jgi:hypothetical protein